MKVETNKKQSPTINCLPEDMTILEQKSCIIWLADNHSLEELRKRQTLIELQIEIAIKNNYPEKTLKRLNIMQKHTDAAVFYQTWPEDFI